MKKIRRILLIVIILIVGMIGITNIIPETLTKDNIPNYVQAYNHEPDNILDNVFEQDDLVVLPFIFENPDQTITKSYLMGQFEKAGITINNKEDLKDIIVTGDQIKTDSKTYTVLIYGDVDANGIVDSFDALSIIEHVVYGGDKELKGIYKIVADVENNSEQIEVDSFDALRIVEFVIGSETKLVLNEPESLKEANNKLPKISLVGENPQIIKLDNPYVELGATAKDYKGNELKVEIDTSKVDVKKAGEYEVIYTATDEEGNKATRTRDVQVVDYVIGITAVATSKTDYQEYGENFDTSMIVVKATMKSGASEEIEAPNYLVDEYDPNTLGEQTIKIAYITDNTIDDKETTFETTCEVTVVKKVTGINVIETIGLRDGYYRYDSNILTNIVATISSTNDVPLTTGTEDCVLDYELVTPSGTDDGSEVTITPIGGGEFNLNLYATEAGTYKIIPIVTGHKVRKTVKGEITVNVEEDLSVTDIEIDGVKLNDNSTAITVNARKTANRSIKFYHTYYDKNNTAVPVEIKELVGTDLQLSNISGNSIKNVMLLDKDGYGVTYDKTTGILQQNPASIRVTGVSQGNETFEISVTNDPKYYTDTTGNENIFNKTIKVKVEAEARTTGINVASSIDLYTYLPTANTQITSSDGLKEYQYYIDGTTTVSVEGDTPYTIIPITLQDECEEDPITKIIRGKISTTKADHADTQNGYVVLYGENELLGAFIELKAYKAYTGQNGKKYYVEVSNQNDEIDAIGIALVDDENFGIPVEDSIEAVKNGINIGYNGLSNNTVTRQSVKVNVKVKEEKITGITRVDDPTIQQNNYRYDENTIATIKSTKAKALLRNDVLTGGEVKCALSAVLVTPSGTEDGSEVKFVETAERGTFDIKLYPTAAGKYEIIPKATGDRVEGGLIAGLEGNDTKITVTVEENLAVTDIEINGVKITDNVTPITVKERKTVNETIKFYHTYYDKNNKAIPVEIKELVGTDLKLTNISSNGIKNVMLLDKDGFGVTYDKTNGTLQQNPMNVRVTGVNQGTETFEISVTNDPKYYKYITANENVFNKTINVTVESEARTTGINVSSSIDLYTYLPTLNTTVTSTDGLKQYQYYTEGTTVVSIEGNVPYTILPITLQDEYKADPITKILYEKIKTTKALNNDTENGYVVLYGEDDYLGYYIEVKAYKAYIGQDGKKYYVEVSNQKDEIDAIGIALVDREEDGLPIEDSIDEVSNGIYIGYNGLSNNTVTRQAAKLDVTIKEQPTQTTFFSLEEPEENEVKEISIKVPPTATYLGDELDYRTAKLIVTMANGKTEEMAITKDMVTGYDKDSLEEQEVVVTYKDKVDTFKVTLVEKEENNTNTNTVGTDGNAIYNNTIDNNTVSNNTIYNNSIDNNTVSNHTSYSNTIDNNTVDNNEVSNNEIYNNTTDNNTIDNSAVYSNAIVNVFNNKITNEQ